MPGSTVLATHERAGRVETTRLGLRIREPTSAPPEQSAPLAAEQPFVAGAASFGALLLEVELESTGESARIDTRLRNASDRPVHVESVALGLRWTDHGVRSLRFLRNGWQSWSYTGAQPLDEVGAPPFPSGSWLRGLHHSLGTPPEDRTGWHESDWVTVVGAAAGGSACCVGALERGRAFGIVYLRPVGDAVLAEVELRLDAVLAAGEERALERVHVALGVDANALLEDFAERHGRLAGARAAAPFVAGWCSWYHFFHDVSEADLLRNLEALSADRNGLPVEVVQLDDGWQRAVGDWLETNDRFPRGLAALAREIRAAGFVPGLWSAPFCVVAESRLFEEHAEWLLADRDGPLRGLLNPRWSADASVYVLDTSRAEVLAHLEALLRTLVEQGFGYLKLDFLYVAALQARAQDPRVGRAERLRGGLEALRRGAGEEAFLLACGCPLGAAVGVVDGMRVGPDVAPSWRAEPALPIPGIEPTLPSTRSAVRSILARAWTHRRLWLNDPDCLVARADAALSDAETRTLAAAIAATGGMFLFSDEVPRLSAARRALVRETLGAARRVDALGLPGRARALELLGGEFASGVVAADAEGASVALVNALDQPSPRRLEVDALGLAPLAGAPEALLGTRPPQSAPPDALTWALAPHESALLRTRRAVRLAVFCDFDGTFSVQDVGATLAKRHAGDRRPAVWARYERGEITAWEYNLEILEGLALPRVEVERFLQTVELDPGARDLVAWCERHGVPFQVLSDGFDANLNRLQQLHRVRFVYQANALRYDRGHWRIAAGHPYPGCGCGTGTCKRGCLEAFRAGRPGAMLVHVGNGRVSDLCGALAADVVFAKDTLASELEALGHPFEPFATLHDVIAGLERLWAGEGSARVPEAR